MMRYLNLLILISLMCACQPAEKKEETPKNKEYKNLGSVIRKSPAADQLVAPNAKIEILAEGFSWAEGPVWVASENMVLFSDVPKNTIHKWTEKEGLSTYLTPSGDTGFAKKGSTQGSNGLLIDPQGKLVLCQHGDRRLARMIADVANPKTDFENIAISYNGKLFNSPNDVTMHSNGSFFFTDPPYGAGDASNRELDFCGVYRVDTSGDVVLLDSTLTRPNGIALSPDGLKLYVANSDPKQALWKVYDLDNEGNVLSSRVFYEVTSEVPKAKGLPDGLKVTPNGHVFATGPGGVWVFDAGGTHLATIQTGDVPTANCGFDADFSTLYMTSQQYLLRIKLKE